MHTGMNRISITRIYRPMRQPNSPSITVSSTFTVGPCPDKHGEGPGAIPAKDEWVKIQLTHDASTGIVGVTINGKAWRAFEAVDLSLWRWQGRHRFLLQYRLFSKREDHRDSGQIALRWSKSQAVRTISRKSVYLGFQPSVR